MSVDYTTNDPKGWCGDPTRGAALGRVAIREEDLATYAGRLHLRRVRLNSGGYDPNGTYFGLGPPLYWIANEEGTIDETTRADNRAKAKAAVQKRYPKARFYR